MSDLPAGYVRVRLDVDGDSAALAGLRDVAARVLRRQLPACWVIEADDDTGVHVRHDANSCKRGGCRDHDGVLVDGSQHYRLPELLRLLLLSHLGVPFVMQRVTPTDDEGLRA